MTAPRALRLDEVHVLAALAAGEVLVAAPAGEGWALAWPGADPDLDVHRDDDQVLAATPATLLERGFVARTPRMGRPCCVLTPAGREQLRDVAATASARTDAGPAVAEARPGPTGRVTHRPNEPRTPQDGRP